MKPIKIIIADDHPLVTEGLKSVLERIPSVEIIGEVSNGLQLLDMLRRGLIPHIILLDLEMPKMSGKEALKIIKSQFPNIKIIIQSFHSGKEISSYYIEAGATAFFSKCDNPELLTKIIMNLLEKTEDSTDYFPLGSIKKVAANIPSHDYPDNLNVNSLTAREKQILYYACEGYNNKLIAATLNISIKTVDFHKSNIIKKTKLFTPLSLVKYAKSIGLID